MPELPVKEVRIAELHLPELKREDIVRTLSEIHLPEIDMPKVEVRRPDMPRVDLRGLDLVRLASGVVASGRMALRIGRPIATRPRWPLIGGAVGVIAIASIVGIALMRSPAMRERAERATQRAREGAERGAHLARERFDAMRSDAEPDDRDIVEAIGTSGVAEAMEDLAPTAIVVETVETSGNGFATIEEPTSPA